MSMSDLSGSPGSEKNDTETASSDPPRRSLLSFEPDALEAEMTALGLPKFRARQLWRWVWRHGVSDFSDMTDLGKPLSC